MFFFFSIFNQPSWWRKKDLQAAHSEQIKPFTYISIIQWVTTMGKIEPFVKSCQQNQNQNVFTMRYTILQCVYEYVRKRLVRAALPLFLRHLIRRYFPIYLINLKLTESYGAISPTFSGGHLSHLLQAPHLKSLTPQIILIP